MVNKVTLIGNLGADPEVRRLESGAVVAKLRIATSENYKDKAGEWQSQTEWHSVVMWRNLAERAEQYLKKGNMVYVEGKLTTRKWEDKDGNARYTTEVQANYYRAIKREESGNGGNGGGNFPSNEYPTANNNANKTQEKVADAAPAPDDDLPF